MRSIYLVAVASLFLAACSPPRIDLDLDGGSNTAVDGGHSDGGAATCGTQNHACCAGNMCETGFDCHAGTCLPGRTGPTGMTCASSGECGMGGTCVPGADGGGTCTTSCSTGADCIAGWSCGPETGATGNVCRCTPTTESCNLKDDDCDGIIDNSPAANASCILEYGASGVCQAGQCACPNMCGATCTDFNTDKNNCGACGVACAATETCTAGACATITSHCTPGTPAEIAANCVCQAKVDCTAGNTAKWACTPAKACVRICTSIADCDSGDVCEDLVCRPSACGEDGDCLGGQQCLGGHCQAPLAASAVASCVVLPPAGVITQGGTKTFTVTAYDSAGRALPYKGTVTWSASASFGVSTTDTGSRATFTSSGTAPGSVSVSATIGSAACSPATLLQYAPSNASLRVVVIDQTSGAPIQGAVVVLQDGGNPVTTPATGVATFSTASGAHTISVFETNHRYVTVMGTVATDVLIALPPRPNRAIYRDTMVDTDFGGLANPNGTYHTLCAGSSLQGNLVDTDLLQMTGVETVPTSISLGTGTPYGPLEVPQGIVTGLGAQLYTPGGQFSVEVLPTPHDLWSIGGNAVIGDVLKAIGPILNGGGGSINDQLPTIINALAPISGAFESGVLAGLKPTPGQMTQFQSGTRPLLPSTLPRLHTNLHLPTLGTYVDENGDTKGFNAVLVQGGSLGRSTGFTPTGMAFGVDQSGSAGSNVPDGVVDAVGTGGHAGQLPLRLAPRHGGLEVSPWGVLTMEASSASTLWADYCSPTVFPLLNDGSGIIAPVVVTGRITRPQAISYNNGALTDVTVDPFIAVPGLPLINDRTVTLASTSGTLLNRLDVGTPNSGWLIYFPAGTSTVTIPTPAAGFSDPYDASSPLRLTTTSLGFDSQPTYDELVQFDGLDLDDYSSVTDAFAIREIPRQ